MDRNRHWIAVVAAVGLTSCTTTPGPKPGREALEHAASARTAHAEDLLQRGDYSAAMIECIDLAHADPRTPGLFDLQQRIMAKLETERATQAAARATLSASRMVTDVDANRVVPDTYGLRRNVKVPPSSLRAPDSPTQKALQKKISVHLDNVDLNNFILTLMSAEKIGIVADSNIAAGKTVTVNADQVPLAEVLEYVARNLGIAFYVGDNVIWATAKEQTGPGIPLETRIYRLHKGISPSAKLQPAANAATRSGGGLAASSSAAAARDGAELTDLEQAIARFIPKPEGADALFDKKTHTLLVKNTRENLAKVEDIIEALDVSPPQVLIEARFISTQVKDLSELGIDWVLNSPFGVTKTGAGANLTQVDAGATVGYAAFPNAAQGLNLTYQGLLTDPMFKAVLHALETSGKTRTLSVPKVTTVNNRPAMIRVGEDFRFFEEYNVQSIPGQISNNGATTYSSILVPVGTPTLEELGYQLQVTPSVGFDLNSITLQLLPEISRFVRYETFQVGSGASASGGNNNLTTNELSVVKLPIFERSIIDTEVIVQSGETVVMGGLISSADARNRSGVPILSSIPLIGRLFTYDSTDNARQNLLIFVTATILSQRGENLVPLESARPTGSPAAAPRGP